MKVSSLKHRALAPDELSVLIANLRKKMGLSQEELAGKASVDVRTIQRIEQKGISNIKTSSKLANAFGLDSDVFYKPIRIKEIQVEKSILPIEKINEGKLLLNLIKSCDLYGFDCKKVTKDAEYFWAELMDYIDGLSKIHFKLREVELLQKQKELQEMINKLNQEGFCIGFVNQKLIDVPDNIFTKATVYILAPCSDFPDLYQSL